MASQRALSENSVSQAEEITKVAVASQSGTFINHGDIVAKFIDIVAEKLQELRDRGR